MNSQKNTQSQGIAYALAAYTTWGLFPLYWKILKNVPAPIILCHRILWSAVFFVFLLCRQGKKNSDLKRLLITTIRSKQKILFLLASSALISANWFVYVYAVNSGRVIQTSLGYFMNPLLSVLLGRVVLGERLSRRQLLAVLLASAGVLTLAWNSGGLPVLSLLLAFSFSTYGLVRKTMPSTVEPLEASFLEALILSPIALSILFHLNWGYPEAVSSYHLPLLMVGGVVTGTPLYWFALATKRLALSTMGFLLYLTPSIQFILAVFLYKEPFTQDHAICFGLIWLGLILYSSELARKHRRHT